MKGFLKKINQPFIERLTVEYLRNDPTLKSAEMRKTLSLSAPSMTAIYKKLDIQFDDYTNGAAKILTPNSVRKILTHRGYSYPKSSEVISFMICKGGTGKSSSTFYIGQRMVSYGARVLLIDADPQGNLTSAFHLEKYGEEIDEDTPVLVDIIANKIPIKKAIIPISEHLHIVPSTPMNSTLDSKILEKSKNPALALSKHLDAIRKEYDYILIDCAPALNLTNTAMVAASNHIILPVNPDSFAYMGLNQTLEEIETIKQDFDLENKLNIHVLFSKYDARENTSRKYIGAVSESQKDRLYRSVIRTCSDIKNAIDNDNDLFGMTSSKAKSDYDDLTIEIMELEKVIKN